MQERGRRLAVSLLQCVKSDQTSIPLYGIWDSDQIDEDMRDTIEQIFFPLMPELNIETEQT